MNENVLQKRVYFTQFTNLFRDVEGLNGQEKYLYLVLASYAGQNGFAFPSIELLSKRIGVSANTIRKLLKSLEEKGGIYICARYDKTTKKRLSNRCYVIDIDYNTGHFDKTLLQPLKLRFPNKIIYE